MVADWIDEYNDLDHATDATLQDWIRGKVAELGLEDEMVNTAGHDDLRDETPLADMIIMDLPSYTNASGS
jgi:hypothetical protein